MKARHRFFGPVVLTLFSFIFFNFQASADWISRSTEYPSASGLYDALGVTGTVTVGIEPTADGVPANSGEGIVNMYSGVVFNQDGANTGNLTVEESLRIGTGAVGAVKGAALRVVPVADGVGGFDYRTGIGLMNAVDTPLASLDVRGNIWARFMVTPQSSANSNRISLYGTAIPDISSLGAAVTVQPLYVKGSPYIYLNARPAGAGIPAPTGNVGIGTAADPVFVGANKLRVVRGIKANRFDTPSSRDVKTDIRPLGATDYKNILTQIEKTPVNRYRYKEEESTEPLHTGLLLEQAPNELRNADQKTLNIPSEAGFLMAAVKALSSENKALEREIDQLEKLVEKKKGLKK